MAQDERSALIFAVPLDPHYGGRMPEEWCRTSGAQNLSGWSEFLPGHFVVADFVSLASSCRTKLAHSIAPPLQRKPASLGFALGAAFGGLFGWKIAAGTVPLLRLALPNQRSRCKICRRGGPMWPPASLPPSRGKVPPKGADEGDHRELPGSFVGAAHWAARPRRSYGIRSRVSLRPIK